MEEISPTHKGLFISPEDRINNLPNKRKPRKFTWLGILFSLVFIVSVLAVYEWKSQWGTFSGNVALLTIKKRLGTLTTDELSRLASFYEMSGDFQAAEEIFKKLNEIDKKDPDILFNLGIISFQNKKYQTASTCFENMIDNGFLTSSVCYWYGKSLSALGKDKEALNWHYHALELDDNNLSNVVEILTLLRKLKKPFEGLSLIAGYSSLYPNPKVEHYLKPFKIMFNKTDSSEEKASFSIPEINNQYQVPVFFPLLKEPTAFLIDTGAMCMSIPRSLYREGITKNKPTGRKTEIIGVGGAAGIGDIILLEHIEIGSIKLRNVEAVICDKCPPLLGQSVLKRLCLKTENKSGRNFLIISN